MLRRNPLVILLSLEIMLNAVNLLLVARLALRRRQRRPGASRSTVMGVAAAEVVVGLGLIVALARRGARSTSTSCGACTDERRRLRLARAAHAARRPAASTSRVGPSVVPRAGRLGGIALDPRRRSCSRCSRFIDLLGRDDSQRAIVSTGWTLALRRASFHVDASILVDPLSTRDAARRHRRRLPDPRLLGRLHARRRRGAAVLRVPEPVRLLDAAARAGRRTSCSCSSAGAWSASPRTC